MVHTLLGVVRCDGGSLSMVDTETLLDGLEVVIATSALLTALEETVYEFGLLDL